MIKLAYWEKVAAPGLPLIEALDKLQKHLDSVGMGKAAADAAEIDCAQPKNWSQPAQAGKYPAHPAPFPDAARPDDPHHAVRNKGESGLTGYDPVHNPQQPVFYQGEPGNEKMDAGERAAWHGRIRAGAEVGWENPEMKPVDVKVPEALRSEARAKLPDEPYSNTIRKFHPHDPSAGAQLEAFERGETESPVPAPMEINRNIEGARSYSGGDFMQTRNSHFSNKNPEVHSWGSRNSELARAVDDARSQASAMRADQYIHGKPGDPPDPHLAPAVEKMQNASDAQDEHYKKRPESVQGAMDRHDYYSPTLPIARAINATSEHPLGTKSFDVDRESALGLEGGNQGNYKRQLYPGEFKEREGQAAETRLETGKRQARLAKGEDPSQPEEEQQADASPPKSNMHFTDADGKPLSEAEIEAKKSENEDAEKPDASDDAPQEEAPPSKKHASFYDLLKAADTTQDAAGTYSYAAPAPKPPTFWTKVPMSGSGDPFMMERLPRHPAGGGGQGEAVSPFQPPRPAPKSAPVRHGGPQPTEF